MMLKKKRPAISIIVAVCTVIVSIAVVHRSEVQPENKQLLEVSILILVLIGEATYLLVHHQTETIHDLQHNLGIFFDVDPRLAEHRETVSNLLAPERGIAFALHQWILDQSRKALRSGYHKKLFDANRHDQEDSRIKMLAWITGHSTREILACGYVDPTHVAYFWKQKEALETFFKAQYKAARRGVSIKRIFLVATGLSSADAEYFLRGVLPRLPKHSNVQHYWLQESEVKKAFAQAAAQGRKLSIPSRGFFVADGQFLSEGLSGGRLPHCTFDLVDKDSPNREIATAIEQFNVLMNCPSKRPLDPQGIRQLEQFLGLPNVANETIVIAGEGNNERGTAH
jgi:hypothetical protein